MFTYAGLTILGIVTFSLFVFALDPDNSMQIGRYVVGVEVNLQLSSFMATRISHQRNLCQCQLELGLCMHANCTSSRPIHNYPYVVKSFVWSTPCGSFSDLEEFDWFNI